MLAAQIKDSKLRHYFFKYELKKKINKFLFINFLSKKKKLFFSKIFLKLNSKILKYSKTKLINRCIINNRNRRVLRMYAISGLYMRNLLQLGIISGFKKSVW